MANGCGGSRGVNRGGLRRLVVHHHDIALRLAKYFGTTPQLWLNLQSGYGLRRARVADARGIDGQRIEPRVRVQAE